MNDLQAESRHQWETYDLIDRLIRAARQEPTCKWLRIERKDETDWCRLDSFLWYSECGGKEWSFDKGGGPFTNGMTFCPKCGKKLKEGEG